LSLFEKEKKKGLASNILLNYIVNQKKEEMIHIHNGIDPKNGNKYMHIKTIIP
jgi:hypothetical protein